jgi:hypothetical protein
LYAFSEMGDGSVRGALHQRVWWLVGLGVFIASVDLGPADLLVSRSYRLAFEAVGRATQLCGDYLGRLGLGLGGRRLVGGGHCSGDGSFLCDRGGQGDTNGGLTERWAISGDA